MEALEEQLSHLNIAKRSAMKDSATYILDIDVSESTEEKNCQTVAILCSDKTIRLYNKETMACLQEYNARPDVLSGVRFSHTNSNLVFSACSNATVRLWDARVCGTGAVLEFTGYPSNVFISFDISCNDLVVCAGTEKVDDDAFLVFWDGRYTPDTGSKEPLGAYSESHNDDITQVRFHPTNPSLLATGSTDGLVNVFDINENNEDDALTTTCNSDSSVNIIGWAGRDYKQVYCLTHNEGFLWWDLAQVDTEEPITLCKVEDIRENVSGYNIDYLIDGVYHKKQDTLLLLGGSHNGDISLFNCDLDKVTHVRTLTRGHTATVRSVYWGGEDGSLITGGEDAQLLLWKPKAKDLSPKKRDSLKMASSVQQRVRLHNNKSFVTKQK
ncbi:WD repeat-containing protein 89 [Hyla sarda]|uniref:WD repeat-containing protein 89 n=1 Tax=Hyla sarda TaxID=327740 RepID=UPI0024C41887|nr:WD repeat-containing protein 89 [Hyla sarda]